jgi:diguanylate cyclase (GGDEF)-like protein
MRAGTVTNNHSMKKHDLHRWLRATIQPATYLGLTMLALVWGAIYFEIRQERNRAYLDAKQATSNLATAFEEHVFRTIKSIDQSLLILRELYKRNHANQDLIDWIVRSKIHNDQTLQFSIVDANGIVRKSNFPLNREIDVSNREHFRVHINAKTDDLFISKPVVGRASLKWSVQLTRRLSASDGSFAGILVASLDPYSLSNFYNSIELDPEATVTLVGYDGVVRVRRGATVGKRTDGRKITTVGSRLLAMAQAEPVGTYWGNQKNFDGVKRLLSYRTVREYPLIVTVGFAEDQIFRDSQRNANAYYIFGLGITVFILIAIGSSTARAMKLSAATSALEITNARFHASLENMPHALCMFDSDQRLIICNKRYTEMYNLVFEQTKPGTTLRNVLNARVRAGCCPEDSDLYIESRLEEVSQPYPYHVVNLLRDGRVIAVDHQPMSDGGWVAVHQDITAQKRTESEIAYLAHHDALTNLANRVLFLEKIEEALIRLRCRNVPFAILLLDLDQFKAVNDWLGHPVGDDLLKLVAQRLRACTRESDTVARLGGDEFAVLQTVEGDLKESSAVLGHRLLESIGAPYRLNGHDIIIGASIGIVSAPDDGSRADELLRNADLALYKAKSEGRNAYCIFRAEMGAEAQLRHTLESDLRDAIARNEFELYYQTIVDVATRKVCSVEALVRWNHPRSGLVYPDSFIPLAEASGLIMPLSEWILRKACMDARLWSPDIKVAVNLSPVQFRSGNPVEIVTNALDASGISPRRLELEITESVLLHNNDGNIALLNELQSAGVSIALDDFGTGYSSLSYLRIFPFDKIKIDKSFVAELSQSGDSAAIVCAITSLGRSLNIETTAEGVETLEQFELLRAAGCTQAQGFLFDHPRPISELEFSTKTRGGVPK